MSVTIADEYKKQGDVGDISLFLYLVAFVNKKLSQSANKKMSQF